jgi:hypothetical protein
MMRGLVPLIPTCMILVLLAGCLSEEPKSRDGPGPTETGVQWQDKLEFVATSNFTALIPYAAESEVTVLDGNLTLAGPIWKTYYLMRFDQEPQIETLRFLGAQREAQHRAATYVENDWTGERAVTCLDPTRAEPCPRWAAAHPNWTNDRAPIYLDDTVPPGKGYFLLHAEFEKTFRLNITFSPGIRFGPPVFNQSSYVVTWDQFDSRFANVTHCGSVYACGVLIDAQYPVSIPEHDWAIWGIDGTFGPAAALSICVLGTSVPECADVFPSPFRHYTSHWIVVEGDSPGRWQVNAFGAGPQGRTASSFTFHLMGFGFDLPESHPL